MAKSVLDLYELYNLVIARGGLVECEKKNLSTRSELDAAIEGNKREGRRASGQYDAQAALGMFIFNVLVTKYLYDYEYEKKNLSTRSELDAVIEGNKREGRRASGQYDAQAALGMVNINTVYIQCVGTKYLYDYEYEKKNLSTRSELDAAIEGNKREGRRASGQYDAQAAIGMFIFNVLATKYLYDYEYEKKNLSTRSELDAVIEGNKREERRASGQYDAQAALGMPPLNRGVPASLAQLSQHMQPLSLSLGGGVAGVPRLPPLPPHAPHISQHDIEYRVREYMKMIQTQRELMRNGSESPPSGANGPASMMSPRDAAALSAIDVSRLTLWSLYNNNNNSPAADLEPQRESPNSSMSGGKREACRSPPPPAKRRTPRPPSPRLPSPPRQACVLFPSQNGNGQNGHRQMVS
ncbi:Protein dead ringer [Operophtera brumata]|uniref:Protein dead ringer n=1 Tax=Operophtera brumata TaxID=104452 RepID=A0A0L7LHV6_OPEBR|nr:Protein dead ringer [Operophtera brumata]